MIQIFFFFLSSIFAFYSDIYRSIRTKYYIKLAQSIGSLIEVVFGFKTTPNMKTLYMYSFSYFCKKGSNTEVEICHKRQKNL